MSFLSKSAIGLGNGTFVLDEVRVFPPKEDEVLIQMKAAALCHTDMDSMSWGKPIIMGHEGAGIVHQTGNLVEDLKPGDRVVLNWATPCKSCEPCQRGHEHICSTNSPVVVGKNGYSPGHARLNGSQWKQKPIERSFNLGTLSEYVLVRRTALTKISVDRLSFSSASILSCGVMTGFGSVVNIAKVKAGSTVTVLGTGGVGLNVIQGAKISKASKIIGVDVNENRLEMALNFGATDVVLADPSDSGLLVAAERVKVLNGGAGTDYAFECTAMPELGAAPLAMIRNAGMAVQVSGIEQEISIDMNLFEWDKVYINPLYGGCNPDRDFPKMMDLYDSGDLLLDEMVTNTYPLEELETAFDDMLLGKNAKGVITF